MKNSKAKMNGWLQLTLRVLDGENPIPSPFAADGVMESVFFEYDHDNFMVHGLVWCSVTHQAVHVGKMQRSGHLNIVDKKEEAHVKSNMPKLNILMFIN
ncbi:hypothetical protein [Chitinophaga sp. Cy-1792]|uniref:hypothetical protein n=1 Tax=Chitinophaga sp. Cy-1792 TaxID=2608339 RepID=UPI0014249E62|nr:hypothetical protein [Chitinophaga sp. Cy-1792]NIG52808.1 hypothetical protein [Chitinophaga sp. Cy-1792]